MTGPRRARRRAGAALVAALATGIAATLAATSAGAAAPAAAVAPAAAAGRHGVGAGAPGGDLRVIGASAALAGAVVAVDGRVVPGRLAYAAATPALAVGAGRHRVRVGSVSGVVDVVAGCTTDVVAAERPVGAVPALVPVRACGVGRIAAGRARVTVLVASDEPGRVRASAGPDAVEVEPFTVSAPLDVPAGRSTLRLAAAAGQRRGVSYATTGADLAAGTATLAVFAGGGERAFRIFGVFDGAQAAAPPTATEINTGLPAPGPAPRAGLPAGAPAAAAASLVVLAAIARRRWGRRHLAGLVAVALLVGGCGAAAGPARPGPPASAGDAAPGPGPRPPRPVPEGGTAGAPLVTRAPAPVPAPVRVRIPSLGVDARVVPLAAAQAAALPAVLDRADVGWFRGPAPGAVGTATLAGHAVGSGGGAFGRLTDLAAGADVVVTDAAGRDHRFAVEGEAVYRKDRVPAAVWAPVRRPTLVLVSCTGPRRADGLHRDNVVVWAVPA